MKRSSLWAGAVTAPVAALLLLGALPAAGAENPKLVLQITVDQLRGDMPLHQKIS